ncbi:MAG TPA: MmgE/PrpD family protein [Bryobacteraceae bacterium]|nr:MmgE/PrpD family protein [Bryobacteraceae bacterium]
MGNAKKADTVISQSPALRRRDIMKLGVGTGVAVNLLKPLAAQQPAAPSGGLGPASSQNVQRWPDIQESREVAATTQTGYTVSTGPGWVNNSSRAFGNGPMDECSRRIVEFVSSYSESKLTAPLVETINYLMVDTLAAFYGGFESEPLRIIARLSETMPGPCTVAGYGIKTTYEMASFANAAMIRHTDFNTAPHNNEMFGGVLAVGEALHSTGPQVLAAMVIAYEVVTAIGNTGQGNYDPSGWDCPYHSVGTAMGVGKLMGLNQDQLANALSLALVPHMPMYVCHIGTQSMWKGTHSAEQVRNGVWGAMLAQQGMTGPCTPFEGRDGLIAHIGPFTRDLRLPTSPDGRMALETIHGNGGGYKRVASEGNTQNFHQNIAPDIIEWTRPEEIASIDVQFHYFGWQEISDPPKWDPRNRETADHSMPYNIARHLLDKRIYLDSFTREKYMDPAARELMGRITIRPLLDRTVGGGTVVTVRKKSGEQRVFMGKAVAPMSHDELIQKYNRLSDFMQISREQRERAREQWMNLRACRDIADAMQTIAKFGQPKPLSDRTPARIS